LFKRRQFFWQVFEVVADLDYRNKKRACFRQEAGT
jgi:hypothetical protein